MTSTLRHRTRWGSRHSPRLALVSGLVLLFTLGVGGRTVAARLSQEPPSRPSGDLLVSDGPTRARFSALDPETLVDVPTASLVPAGPYSRALSADGSTLASLIGVSNVIVIQDARTGAQQAQFAAPTGLGPLLVNRDGTRLVLESPGSTDDAKAPRWTVLDGRTGQILSQVRADRPSIVPGVLDPAGAYLYQLAVPGGQAGLQPVELIRYDLYTGTPAGRLVLPDILAGSWPTNKMMQGEQLRSLFAPGIAVSPDGQQLAIAHAESAQATFIAAEPLAVERTTLIEPPANPVGWLVPEVRTAWAKQPPEGTVRWATYSADAQHVYVWGRQTQVDAQGQVSYDNFGVDAMSPNGGGVAAESLRNTWVDQLVPSPDGRSVYVLGLADPSATSETDTSPYLLRRLDASSLATLSQRELSGYHSLFVRVHQ